MEGIVGNKNLPSISVIIAAYNSASFIKRAIDSVLAQSFHDFELIIVDDGSEDNTHEVVKKSIDGRIKYIKHDINRGEAAARNTGINAAGTDYIAFLDSDDEALPDRMEEQIRVLTGCPNEIGVVYTDMIRVGRDGKEKYISSPDITPGLKNGYRSALSGKSFKIGVGTCLFRKDCLKKIGGFDSKLPYYVDMDLFIRFSRRYGFLHIRKPLIKYRYEGADDPLWNLDKKISSWKYILDKYYSDIVKYPRILARHYFKMAFLWLAKDKKASREYSLKAIKISPFNAKYTLVFFASFLGQGVCANMVRRVM